MDLRTRDLSTGRICVPGGCGCIGNHGLVDSLAAGLAAIFIDDNSRTGDSDLDGVWKLTAAIRSGWSQTCGKRTA